DVPAGSSTTQRAVERGLAGASGTPDQAVEGVLLARAVWIATAVAEDGEHLLASPAGLVTEGRVRRDGEVEVFLHLVHRARLLQPLDQVDDQAERLLGPREVVRWEEP